MRQLRLALTTGALVAAGCSGEPTGVNVAPAYVTWVEWPTTVTTKRPGALRVSGYTECPYRAVFGVSVSGMEIRVTAQGRDPANDVACLAMQIAGSADTSGSSGGAGYDTLLPLPPLTPPASGLPAWFSISAPMAAGPGAWAGGDLVVGQIYLQATADTATQFAGRAMVISDSSGCWRLTPFSRAPYPRWVFNRPVRLLSEYRYYGFVSGRFVRADPPICGDSIAVLATRLEVDVTPWEARLARSP